MKVVFTIYEISKYGESPMLTYEDSFVDAEQQIRKYQKDDVAESSKAGSYIIYAACVPNEFEFDESQIEDRKEIEILEGGEK